MGLATSSGLDSLALLGLIKKSSKPQKLTKCFALDFGKDFSEFFEANKNITKFGMQAVRVVYSVDDMINDFEKLVIANEAPVGGLMHMGLSKLCKTSKDFNIKVMLSGMGADEILLGYESTKLSFYNNLDSVNNSFKTN